MNRIKDLRTDLDLSQGQLGKKLGCSSVTVSRYESESRQLDPATIHALCDIFGCTADYLLCRSDTPLPALTDGQARLLAAYEAADDNVKRSIDVLLRLDVPEEKKARARTSA